MTNARTLIRHLARLPAVAVACYVGAVVAMTFTTWAAVADIQQRRAAIAEAKSLLGQIEGRRIAGGDPEAPAGPIPTGSPFLEGQTVTVAGAAILQRVASAVRRYGGNVLSSQVELEGSQSKTGLVGVTMSCELDQPELQRLLYDLEAGMPFLFVNQLSIQAGQGISGAEGGKLRVLLGVSGQWQGAK
jgi:general secretion pathway protein M